MDQNFNNGFDNQNTGSDGYNNSPYSNPYDQSQQNYYNSYEQSTQQTQQNYAQQYQQTYGQPQQDYNQYNQYDQSYNQPYNQPYGQQYGSMYQEDKSIKRFAIASLVLGIVSFFCCGIITSILAIVFGRISLSKQPMNNGLAKAGFILGIIGLVGSILGTILMNCTGAIDSSFSEYMCHFFM